MHTMLGRFRKAKDGLAAVEFALLLPVMITLFFGVVEVSLALMCRADVTNVAAQAPPQPPAPKIDIPVPPAPEPPEPQMRDVEPAPEPPVPKFDVEKEKKPDTDTPPIVAGLVITTTDGSATYTPGGNGVYTVTVTNNATILTYGGDAAGIYAQSVGGGGGKSGSTTTSAR